jgi:hypothetical protein
MTVKVYAGVFAVCVIGLNGLKIYNHVQNRKLQKKINLLKKKIDENNVIFYDIVEQCSKSKEFPVRYLIETDRGVFEI